MKQSPKNPAHDAGGGELTARIEQKLRLLPDRPGVYLFKDGRGQVIYVGKAKRLPARVRSYFRGGGAPSERTEILVAAVRDLDYIVTASETEALILEANLVRSYAPHYNVQLKDDKRFPFLKIDVQDPFPRLVLTRRIVPDGSRYFGPFTHVKELRHLLRTLRKIFPLRTCSDREMKKRQRPCLDYFIGLCPGPCAGLTDPEQYRATVENLIAFLEGRGEHLLDAWRLRMQQLSRALRFEESAKLRDDISGLEQLMESQRMADVERPDLDVIGLAFRGATAVATIFSHRQGAVIASRRVTIARAEVAEPTEIMEAVLSDHYRRHRQIPPLLLLSALPANPDLMEHWLNSRAGRRVRLRRPQRGNHLQLLRAAQENAHLFLEERELIERGRRERMASAVYAVQEALRLAAAPARIEGYDISDLQGGNAVGSRVVFTNGEPRKGAYRRYRIRTVEGADDFAMLGEVLSRRMRRLAQGEDEPDLVLVDGGLGQVNRAAAILAAEGYGHIPIAGLAKREEEIYLPGRAVPLRLPRSSPGLQLLQRVRDEAHRFAIDYHRAVRAKRLVRSPLAAVRGLGQGRSAALLAHFSGLPGLARATEEEIRAVPGIGRALAGRIVAALKEAGLHE
ncbi:MAG: excinuclease ABC subunit UvrC [Candidatus Eisenbacteria bacterium]